MKNDMSFVSRNTVHLFRLSIATADDAYSVTVD